MYLRIQGRIRTRRLAAPRVLLALLPALALSLTGCGIGSAISAISSADDIANNGGGFTTDVIQNDVAVPTVGSAALNTTNGSAGPPVTVTINTGSTSGTTTGGASTGTATTGGVSTNGVTTGSTSIVTLPVTGPASVPINPVAYIPTSQEATILKEIQGGQFNDLDLSLRLTDTGGPAWVGMVFSTNPNLGSTEFWQIAGSATPDSSGAIGGLVDVPTPGSYAYGPSDPGVAGFTYSGSVWQATTAAGGNVDRTLIIQHFTTMINSHLPVYVYVGSQARATTATVVIKSLSVTGHVLPNL